MFPGPDRNFVDERTLPMRKFLMAAALLVLGAGLLAGCGAQLTAPEIIQHLKDTAAQTQDVHMVVDLNLNMTGSGTAAKAGQAGGPASMLPNLPKSGQATIELWYKQPTLVRAEIKSMT